ncbi:hypothetical protein PUN28_002880 [Cardiocondyla obscurior]|uniref:Uncharacterized protein n=1 Tax=Cardiocondyla obscurior TaxID=286306 RepID=A0AAW2GWP8_9HYME
MPWYMVTFTLSCHPAFLLIHHMFRIKHRYFNFQLQNEIILYGMAFNRRLNRFLLFPNIPLRYRQINEISYQ